MLLEKLCLALGVLLLYIAGPRPQMLREGAQNPVLILWCFWSGFALVGLGMLLWCLANWARTRVRRAEEALARWNRERTFRFWLST